MMIRGDQHVDHWAEIAIDYLDGQLDPQTRLAVEAHLSACPECAARLRKQEYVVTFLQETPLADPPEDLEYRSIGELIFPSPGTEPVIRPRGDVKIYRTSGWYRKFRAWIPATVAVCALLAAIVGYGIARSGSGAEVATDSARVAIPTTVAAGAATTAAPAASLGEAAPTTTAAGATMTMAPAATTTTAGAGAESTLATRMSTFGVTNDPKAMVRALQNAQAPTFVAFHAAVSAQPPEDQGSNTTAAATTTAASTSTTIGGTETTDGPAGSEPSSQTGTPKNGAVSAKQAEDLLEQIKQFTGLEPLDESLWLGGPTFAVFLPREDAAELVDLVDSISNSFGLTVSLEGGPPSQAGGTFTQLLEHKSSFPILAAQRAGQPSTWNYDFTTSTLATDSSGHANAFPDEAGTHVLVVIWIPE
jgi:hypothetical protein